MKMKRPHILAAAMAIPSITSAATFVTYPGHVTTHGSHAVPAAWDVVDTTVTFSADESIGYTDSPLSSQRTALNTLTYTVASSGAPRPYDNPAVFSAYGSTLPLLMQFSSGGVSVLTYRFASPISRALDLFLTDVDTGDAVTVTAFGPGGTPLTLSSWQLVGEGDLSLYQDVGSALGPLATPPTVFISSSSIDVTAAVDYNQNRSYTILRTPEGQAIESINITFTGNLTPTLNGSDPLLAWNGSHIYTGLALAVPEPSVPLLALLAAAPSLLFRRRTSRG